MDYGETTLVFLKKAGLAIVAYYIGYIQYSILWIVLAVILDIAKDLHLKSKLTRRDLHRKLATNGEKDVIGSLSNLRSWVCFPDMERAEWANRIIRQLWPNVNNYVHDVIKEMLQNKLNKKLGNKNLFFERLFVGKIPFRIGGIIVYEHTSQDEIVLDMDISYAGDCHIVITYGTLKGNIKDFQLYGKMRVIIKPLIDVLPLAGGFQAFFLNKPDIDFDLDGVGGLLEFPGFKQLLKKMILDSISSVIVLPNKYPMRFSKKISKQDIKIPRPKGVLRIHLIQASKLVKTDILLTDPYAILSVGNQEYQTSVMEQTTRPKFDYWCEFIVEEIRSVNLLISLWDCNTIQEDESLGSTKVDLADLVNNQNRDMYLNLRGVKHGHVHIRSTWLTLSSTRDDLQLIKNEIRQLKVPSLSSAILTVFVDSASNIYVDSDSTEKLYTYVQIEVGKQQRTTKTFKKQIDPVWEEGFIFLVPNPEDDYVVYKLFNEKEEKIIGSVIYSIDTLFHEDDFTVHKKIFKLSQCETDSEIYISMNLKILKNESTKNEDETNIKIPKQPAGKPKNDSSTANHLTEHSSLSSSSSSSSNSSDSDSVKSDILSPAKIKLTLRYSVQRQRLIVVVHHVEDLRFDETKGIYVKLYLLPERHKDTKRRTEVIRTGKDPIFDESFEFFIPQEELGKQHLEVSVCEEKMLKNETIEKVVIDLDKLSLVLPHTRLFRLYHKSHES